MYKRVQGGLQTFGGTWRDFRGKGEKARAKTFLPNSLELKMFTMLLTKCVDVDIYRARGGAVLTGAGCGALTLGVGGEAAQGARNT